MNTIKIPPQFNGSYTRYYQALKAKYGTVIDNNNTFNIENEKGYIIESIDLLNLRSLMAIELSNIFIEDGKKIANSLLANSRYPDEKVTNKTYETLILGI